MDNGGSPAPGWQRFLAELKRRNVFKVAAVYGAVGFVVLHGKSGTLAELALLWALDRAGCLDRRPVVLLGDGWSALLAFLQRSEMLEPAQQRITRVAATPEDAMSELTRLLAGEEPA